MSPHLNKFLISKGSRVEDQSESHLAFPFLDNTPILDLASLILFVCRYSIHPLFKNGLESVQNVGEVSFEH